MDYRQYSPAMHAGTKALVSKGAITMAMAFAIGMSSVAGAQASPSSQAIEADTAGFKVAEAIPGRCNTYVMSERIEHELPQIVPHSGSVSTISNVEFLTDVRRVTYAPANGQEVERHMLQCPVRVTWDNGRQDFGYYTEWEDSNQQVRVSFAPRPMQLPQRQ